MRKENLLPISVGEIAFISGMASALCGGIGVFIGGPQLAAESLIGTNSLIAGVILELGTNFRAVELARIGKTERAFLESLAGSFQTALSFAISGAAFGAIAGRDKVITAAVVGGLIGGVTSLASNGYSLYKTLRQKEQTRNIPKV